ncbi:MAG: hypothetical protein AAFU65_12835, partial [Pseudomonadota bacterium]
ALAAAPLPGQEATSATDHAALTRLFADWRAFETAPMRDGAPDYSSARFEKAHKALGGFRDRLHALDIDDWPLAQQVDWHILRAEINGFDFNVQVLRPFERDPAFYQSIWTYKSDVPAHEGPTHHAVLELWTYSFPLSDDELARMKKELAVIAPLMRQAKENLTGNARDLWVAGIRNIRRQVALLDQIGLNTAERKDAELEALLSDAKLATIELLGWLELQAPGKTGPSGVGIKRYTWYMNQVHYVPMSWEDEMRLLQREQDRAWSSLKLEEHRNRKLPPIEAANTPEEWKTLTEASADRLIRWLHEEGVIPAKDYHRPALYERLGSFVPEEDRNFFWIAAHLDPTPLYTHFYHWFDLAQMDLEPHESPIRRGPLLYNIFDSRNEGTATGVEEMFMHAGLYDDRPRSRELVWIMLAQRAARGLGSLYAHANQMTMAEAGTVHVKWTPREWMSNEPDLLQFEQHLYLRQPGYGTSYVTGKYLLERLLAYRTEQTEGRDPPYGLADFFGELNQAGSVPVALVHWQLTGDDADIRKIMDAAGPVPD